MKNYIQNLSQKIFSLVKRNEEVGLFLHSEESFFVRFNGAQVRQNTNVNQHELTLTYQIEQRLIKQTFNLTCDLETDFNQAQSCIELARTQLPMTDINPQYVAMTNGGQTETIKKVQRPSDDQIIQTITEIFSGCDLAGLWCSGPLRQVSANSKGQFHYFENDYFFFDYSIYNGPKAAKGFYSATEWNLESFKNKAQNTKNKLQLLMRETKAVPRGKYNVYLEPMAVNEIMGTMSWGGLSQAAYQQGRSPIKLLIDQQKTWSEKITLIENFESGFVPRFNSLGEQVPSQITLIENGKLKNLLTSSATAQEFNLQTNYANPGESPRALQLRAGTLKQSDILKQLGTGLYLSNLHYINWSDINSGRMTGMTRFACFWVENGEIVAPIQDLRFDETVFNVFGDNCLAVTEETEVFVDVMTYAKRSLGMTEVPGLFIKDFNFTL